jgi:DNA-binding transcriptional LysR family regulator
MIEFSLLKHFIAVAQTGSFTRASEQLHSTQSVVSRSVKRLEDEIGTELLARTTRNVNVTPAGEAFLAEAISIVNRLAVARSHAKRIGRGETANLRVGVCPSTESDSPRIWRGLAGFRQAWPLVDLELKTTLSPLQVLALRAAEMDVGILRPGDGDRTGLEWRVIARAELMVAIPRVWNMRKTQIRLDELRDKPWIMPNPKIAPARFDRLVNLCREYGFEPNIAGLAEDLITSRIMIGCGLGAAFVNVSMPHDREEYEVVPLKKLPAGWAAETIVAWAAGSNSVQIDELVRRIMEAGAATPKLARSRRRANM